MLAWARHNTQGWNGHVGCCLACFCQRGWLLNWIPLLTPGQLASSCVGLDTYIQISILLVFHLLVWGIHCTNDMLTVQRNYHSRYSMWVWTAAPSLGELLFLEIHSTIQYSMTGHSSECATLTSQWETFPGNHIYQRRRERFFFSGAAPLTWCKSDFSCALCQVDIICFN